MPLSGSVVRTPKDTSDSTAGKNTQVLVVLPVVVCGSPRLMMANQILDLHLVAGEDLLCLWKGLPHWPFSDSSKRTLIDKRGGPLQKTLEPAGM